MLQTERWLTLKHVCFEAEDGGGGGQRMWRDGPNDACRTGNCMLVMVRSPKPGSTTKIQVVHSTVQPVLSNLIRKQGQDTFGGRAVHLAHHHKLEVLVADGLLRFKRRGAAASMQARWWASRCRNQ